ncbi:MAG: futalosine hydrolase [Desulfobulbaceae bacterium]|nr:futalosine hydrolase [Desulfobulbaceae bacterium]MDP2104571.1 futalosine hydrolase [Desulfobulbaceae bacterium]
MFLIVTATEQEMAPITRHLTGRSGWTSFVAGIGWLESAVNLTRFLAHHSGSFQAIINCGVAGAFVGAGPDLLDICLAETEDLADVGILQSDGIHPFDTILVPTHFPLDPTLLTRAKATLQKNGIQPWSGPFVSVMAVSGTLSRGEELRSRFCALCENMEGAAVARTAQEFHLPCLEIRAISNMVVNRALSAWRLAEASQRCAEALSCLLPELNQ